MGLPVALGQDDIEDAYYPFGRHNMVEIAFLAAHALEGLRPAWPRPRVRRGHDDRGRRARRTRPPARARWQRRPGRAPPRRPARGARAPRAARARGRVRQGGGQLGLGDDVPPAPDAQHRSWALPVVRVAAVQAMPSCWTWRRASRRPWVCSATPPRWAPSSSSSRDLPLALPSHAWAHLPNADARHVLGAVWGSAARCSSAMDRLVAACREQDVLSRDRRQRARARAPRLGLQHPAAGGPDGLRAGTAQLRPTHQARWRAALLGRDRRLELASSGLIAGENRDAPGELGGLPGRPAGLAGADRRRLRGWLATIRHIAIESGAFVVSVPQYIERAAFPDDFRGRCLITRSSVAAARRDRPGIGGRLAGPLYDEEGSSWPTATCARRSTRSAGSMPPATTAAPTCCGRAARDRQDDPLDRTP